MLLLFSSIISAAEQDSITSTVVEIMSIFTVVLVLITLWLALVYSQKEDNEGLMFKKVLSKMFRLIDRSVPVEKEREIMLDHSYDGIKELDNKVPPWFNFLFYGTILFGVVYMINYHVIGSGNVQEEEYQAEMKAAQLQREILVASGAFLNEESVTRLEDAGELSTGKEIYMTNCASCHGNQGGGSVGPNLTDKYWIHGGSIKNIFSTIKYGVPSKGMISWESQLSPKDMQRVASYIMSLKGTDPPNPKAPEGKEYVPEEKSDSKDTEKST